MGGPGWSFCRRVCARRPVPGARPTPGPRRRHRLQLHQCPGGADRPPALPAFIRSLDRVIAARPLTLRLLSMPQSEVFPNAARSVIMASASEYSFVLRSAFADKPAPGIAGDFRITCLLRTSAAWGAPRVMAAGLRPDFAGSCVRRSVRIPGTCVRWDWCEGLAADQPRLTADWDQTPSESLLQEGCEDRRLLRKARQCSGGDVAAAIHNLKQAAASL